MAYKGQADFGGKRVLIAEDSPAVRIMLVAELSELGFEVVETHDGQSAWDEYQKQPFDLVISDVEMPQMDGLALTLRIRQSDRPKTPVIVYSSIGDIGMKARAKFLDVDAHITKLNLNLLIESADKLMRGEKIDETVWDETSQERHLVETVPLD
jgi:CheY-like chemotaxis protein